MTNIYKGSLLGHRTGEAGEEDEFNNNLSGQQGVPVVLKILNQNLEELSLVSFVIFGWYYTKMYWWLLLFHHPFNFSSLGIYWNCKYHEQGIPQSRGAGPWPVSQSTGT